ncbi:MAG: phosphopantothenoylcysteine decarboxylase [Planctomycetota bacterium]|nr:phosphopantothenoylcysteine decarboxylase [Planctomycetota bacterium]
MARILITSGPTRQYIDPVRYLSNASSGQMGYCLAEAALQQGHEVVVVSGPVQLTYPEGCEVIEIMSTEDLLRVCREVFPRCDGLIGAAAPCDYQPVEVADHKIRKTGDSLVIKLVETPDVVATLGSEKKKGQWTVGFALETDDARFRAITKLEKKSCDLVVLNGVAALDSADNEVEIIAPGGQVLQAIAGSKPQVATAILNLINQELIAEQVQHESS